MNIYKQNQPNARSAGISALDVTNPITPLGTLLFDDCTIASVIILCKIALLNSASFPPFNNKPFPDLMASAAICGKQSGRLSKIINSTPINIQ